MISLQDIAHWRAPDPRRQMAAFDQLPRQVRHVIAHADVPVDAESVLQLLYRIPPRTLVAGLQKLLNAEKGA